MSNAKAQLILSLHSLASMSFHFLVPIWCSL